MAAGINIMAGGEAGQGVQSIGAVAAETLARSGYNIFADQDYESRVRGGHNFFRVRAEQGAVGALSVPLDILIALNKESIDLHRDELKPGGVIIYDGEQIPEAGAGERGLSVPFMRLAQNKLMANTAAVGAAFGLAQFDFDILAAVLQQEFGGKGENIVNENVAAAKAGYDYAQEHGKALNFPRLPSLKNQGNKILLNGNDAVSLGALAAGCKFVAGYPMTPSSGILEYVADKGRDYGAVMVHVEDEISAINMAVGAGYAGVRSMVATSGGGCA
jgi:2-oxoglutarate/2-oxoacid ferredoxin oxidoreductase subunit alpha